MPFSSSPSEPGANLLTMPPEILDNIAGFTATATHVSIPEPLTRQPGMLYDTRLRPAPVTTPPADLRTILLVCRRFHDLLNAQANPRLYARVFRSKFDTAVIQRRFGSQAVSSVNLAKELKRRCTILKRIRATVERGTLNEEHLTDNLWLAYMMMMENDGLNLQQLRWAQIESYLALHHQERMLETAVQPGYPPETTDRALALHLVYLLTNPEQLGSESRDESDEKLFILRPFVFAAHKFDAYLAPWTIRNLPLNRHSNSTTDQQQGTTRAQFDPFLADLTPRIRACELEHCGQIIKIATPILAQGACFSFFMKVERDPAVIGMTFLDIGADDLEPKLRRARTSRSPLSLSSEDHDKDVARLLSCADPHRSRGLPPLYCRGMFEGTWEGRFSFFDFDSYREMLAGRMRSLYEGPFGEQPQIWKIKERIVKLSPGELEGGKGSILSAGYPPRGEDADLDEPIADKGKGREDLPHDWHNYPRFDDVSPQDDEEDRYEILLHGTGHSAWGRFVLRGRVRSWDGMLIMNKEYRPDGRGRWLYRGYSVAGGKFVGRWRDTFTSENMCGYEG